jgi:transposase
MSRLRARRLRVGFKDKEPFQMTVMIGIDPHKASHTAVAIDNTEQVLDELRVRACAKQTDQLRTWAAPFPDRVWAIESARGLGYLLAQQLVPADETVVDVPAVMSTRIRLLKLLAKRHRDLGRLRSKAACRLHALLMELEPGGMAKEMLVTRVEDILDRIEPASQMVEHRLAVARETLADIEHDETQMKASMKRLRKLRLNLRLTVQEISVCCRDLLDAFIEGTNLPVWSIAQLLNCRLNPAIRSL